MARRCFLLCAVLLGGCSTTPSGGDGAVEAGVDASTPDLGHDAGPRDTGVDAPDLARPDAGPPICHLGQPCLLDSDCGFGGHCIIDASGAGYCSAAPVWLSTDPGACDPSPPDPTPGDDGCPPCGKCIDYGPFSSAPGAPHHVTCLVRCMPNDVDNDVCADGQQCAPDTQTCMPGECMTDVDCQRYIEDTDGDGVCNGMTGDTVRIDPAGGTCDTGTYRCRRAGTPTARAGDHCMLDSECERDGRCFAQCQFSDFVGGYCTKLYCNVPGRECEPSDICFTQGGAFSLCLRPCTVDAEDPSLVLGPGGHGDTCDPGYACDYDGTSGVGVPHNGGCLPGNYDAVTTNNVGHACGTNSDCYSPHGMGACTFDAGSSACSMTGCAGYPASDNVCGDGNDCFAGFGDGESLCLHVCTTAADCAAIGAPADHGCIALSTTDPQRYCWPACNVDADCQTGHTCTGAAPPATPGTCM